MLPTSAWRSLAPANDPDRRRTYDVWDVQGIFVFEHRRAPHARKIVVAIVVNEFSRW